MTGPDTESAPDWFALGRRHIWLPYTQMKTTPAALQVVATDGVRIKLADGRELIDGIASWWTACHGYNHPHIQAAFSDQLQTMPHVMFGGLNHEPALKLATRLAALLPGDLNRVFFSDSGSVSIDVAMKMALQYWLNQGERGRTRFVSFLGGYHGDTIGAMSICDPDEGMHGLFRGAIPEQHVVALPDSDQARVAFDEFLTRHAHECAAIVLEPLVQGAGGMRFHSTDTLAYIAKTCRAHGLLLIVDEIFTGFGRTGSMFAFEQAGVTPDIVTLSKALTGGTIALAATVATDAVFDAFLSDDPQAALMHGPTFMANPLACAAANASLDLFENVVWQDNVQRIEAHLGAVLTACSELPGVRDVRVKGAIGVVQLDDMARMNWLKGRFVESGVWVRPFGNIVYLTPAFVISDDDLETLTGAVVDVVTEWSKTR